jgi:transposase-like protein
LRYRLTLQDLSEMFLERGIVFSHEAVRQWEAKLTPMLTAEHRQRRHRCSYRGQAVTWAGLVALGVRQR